jgi:putative ABC transport system ATP-binding protein
MEVAKVENVSRVYKIGAIETQALRGVSLTIESGEFVALVGPSGSGKTTLLQLIGCLDQPSSGKVWINGKDATRLNRAQRADMRRGTIGFIFQFFALIPTLTAYENIEMPLLLVGMAAAERRARVNELLRAVELSDRSHHRPDQLSGGQQQRVAIARALSAEPVLILADEPTGNLDTRASNEIVALLRQVSDDWGRSVVMVTHDPSIAAYADRIIFLKDGVIVDETRLETNTAEDVQSVKDRVATL